MNETELLTLLPALDIETLDSFLEEANLTCNGEAYDLIATEIFKRPEFQNHDYKTPYHLHEEWVMRFGDQDDIDSL